MVSGFFDNLRDYSEIKLRILGKFLAPWAAKLGSMSRKGNRLIWYVDGFAGRGTYEDGSDGSPILGLRRARETLAERRGYQLSCFFVEKGLKNWSTLDSLADPFRGAGINVINRHGEFSALVPEIERETRGSPVLLFVDPFGISPLKFHEFRPLLERRWPLDLILTFQHRAVHRLASVHPHLITDAIGTASWFERWSHIGEPAQQTQYVLELLRQNVGRDGKFLEVFYYPIRPSIRASPKYYLLFASRHYDAFELWNDQVAQEETSLSSNAYDILASQASFLPEFDAEFQAINLLNEVRGLMGSMERITRRDLVMELVRSRWGQYHTRDIKKAVTSMLQSGELRREHNLGKTIDDDPIRLA